MSSTLSRLPAPRRVIEGLMSTLQTEPIPVDDYVREGFSPLSNLAHGWELYTALLLTPAEERTMVREPTDAVPESLATRVGKLRVIVVPYIGCFQSGDAVCSAKPSGETHSAVWIEADSRTNLVLACRELDAHDTGFELLASVAQLVIPKLTSGERSTYTKMIEEELHQRTPGEIDKEALVAKEAYLESRRRGGRTSQLEKYVEASLVSTLAEYMHGLWHDVQIRVGLEHLPVPQLHRRMTALAEIFPPNAGYELFDRELHSSS